MCDMVVFSKAASSEVCLSALGFLSLGRAMQGWVHEATCNVLDLGFATCDQSTGFASLGAV